MRVVSDNLEKLLPMAPMKNVNVGGRIPLAGMERKLKKPLMEKRRRARINRCLTELKQILLSEGRNCSSHQGEFSDDSLSAAEQQQRAKMEKADILEMTVQYLRAKSAFDSHREKQSFVAGFQQCSSAVLDFLRRNVHNLPFIQRESNSRTRNDQSQETWNAALVNKLNANLNQTIGHDLHKALNLLQQPPAMCPESRSSSLCHSANLPSSPTLSTPFIASSPNADSIATSSNTSSLPMQFMMNPLSLPPTPPFAAHDLSLSTPCGSFDKRICPDIFNFPAVNPIKQFNNIIIPDIIHKSSVGFMHEPVMNKNQEINYFKLSKSELTFSTNPHGDQTSLSSTPEARCKLAVWRPWCSLSD